MWCPPQIFKIMNIEKIPCGAFPPVQHIFRPPYRALYGQNFKTLQNAIFFDAIYDPNAATSRTFKVASLNLVLWLSTSRGLYLG